MVGIGTVCKYLYPGSALKDYMISTDSGVVSIEHWNEAKLGPKPTIQELEARIPEVLVSLKQQKGLKLKQELEAEISKHYSAFDILSLTNLKLQSLNKPNRLTYLGSLEAWLMESYQLFYTTIATLEAAKNIEEVESVKLDFANWVSRKPNVSYKDAIQIGD